MSMVCHEAGANVRALAHGASASVWVQWQKVPCPEQHVWPNVAAETDTRPPLRTSSSAATLFRSPTALSFSASILSTCTPGPATGRGQICTVITAHMPMLFMALVSCTPWAPLLWAGLVMSAEHRAPLAPLKLHGLHLPSPTPAHVCAACAAADVLVMGSVCMGMVSPNPHAPVRQSVRCTSPRGLSSTECC